MHVNFDNYQLIMDSNMSISTPDLLASSDTGRSNTDNITNAANPVFAGSGATAGSAVRLFANNVQYGSGTADASGNWTITANNLVEANNLHITAAEVDSSGVVGPMSAALDVTVDRTQPGYPTIDLRNEYDSGFYNTDNVTNIQNVLVDFTVPVGTDASSYGTAVQTDANGHWSMAVALRPGGLGSFGNMFSATATDIAGNQTTSYLTVYYDTEAPAYATSPTLVASSDTGASSTDRITNDSTPTIYTGTGEFGGATLYVDGVQVATGTNTAFYFMSPNNIQITAPTLADGVHTLSVVGWDWAGNTKAAPQTLTITVDTQASTPTLLDLVEASDTGISNTDDITGVTKPTIAGKAEASANVFLFDGSTQVGTVKADVSGNWSITTTELALGVHNLTAKAVDVAGNTSGYSDALSITVGLEGNEAALIGQQAAGPTDMFA